MGEQAHNGDSKGRRGVVCSERDTALATAYAIEHIAVKRTRYAAACAKCRVCAHILGGSVRLVSTRARAFFMRLFAFLGERLGSYRLATLYPVRVTPDTNASPIADMMVDASFIGFGATFYHVKLGCLGAVLATRKCVVNRLLGVAVAAAIEKTLRTQYQDVTEWACIRRDKALERLEGDDIPGLVEELSVCATAVKLDAKRLVVGVIELHPTATSIRLAPSEAEKILEEEQREEEKGGNEGLISII